MARGRMLSSSISESLQVASLPDDITRLIFTWLLAHADAAGRYSAHYKIIAGKVLTLLSYTDEIIIRALVALHVAGLIQLYEASGQPYLVFLGWERHQTIRHDREQAKCPEPTTNVPATFLEHFPAEWRASGGHPPGTCRANTGVSSSTSSNQVQDQEEVQTKVSTAASVGSRRPTPEYEEFLEIFNTYRGDLPEAKVLNHKRREGLRRLIAEHGVDAARTLLTDATKFVAADAFWREQGYGLDNLLRQEGCVLEKAEKWGSGGTPEMKKAAAVDEAFEQYKEMGL